MKKPICDCVFPLISAVVAALFLSGSSAGQTASPGQTTLPSETPTQFKVAQETWEYSRREVMISMRDGVKLHTVILVPKGAKNAPILLTRTPYSATELTSHAYSAHLGPS